MANFREKSQCPRCNRVFVVHLKIDDAVLSEKTVEERKAYVESSLVAERKRVNEQPCGEHETLAKSGG